MKIILKKRYTDLFGLPKEVLSNLILKHKKEPSLKEPVYLPTETRKILTLLEKGPLDLNQLIVGMYIEHKKIKRRSAQHQIMTKLIELEYVKKNLKKDFYITAKGKKALKEKPKTIPTK